MLRANGNSGRSFDGPQRPLASQEQPYPLEDIIALQKMLDDGIPEEWLRKQADRDACASRAARCLRWLSRVFNPIRPLVQTLRESLSSRHQSHPKTQNRAIASN
jgi:hypothetical protein